jgi:hypothetical protein
MQPKNHEKQQNREKSKIQSYRYKRHKKRRDTKKKLMEYETGGTTY